MKEQLAKLYREKCVSHGDFVLSSGIKSTFYINSKNVILTGEGLNLVVGCFKELTADWKFDSVGGMELGAVPLSSAWAVLCGLNSFIVRKAAKEHGARSRLEGFVGDCVLVEDVVTTGKTLTEAAEVVRASGGRVVGAVAVVKRGECDFDFPLKYVLDYREII